MEDRRRTQRNDRVIKNSGTNTSNTLEEDNISAVGFLAQSA